MASPDLTAPAPGQAPRDSSAGGSSVQRRRAVTARRVEMLGELAEAGLVIVRALERRVLALSPPPEAAPAEPVPSESAPSEPTPPGSAVLEPGQSAPARPAPGTPDTLADLALAYGRVSRSVRQTLMLQEKLSHGPRGAARGEGRRRLNELSEAGDPKLTEVSQTLLRVISAEPDDKDGVERLLREAWERLEDEELLEDWARLPAGQIVARVCRDIGVTSEWSRWSLDLHGIAMDEAPTCSDPTDSAPGSPPASWLREMPPGVRRPPEELAAAVAAGFGRARSAGSRPPSIERAQGP